MGNSKKRDNKDVMHSTVQIWKVSPSDFFFSLEEVGLHWFLDCQRGVCPVREWAWPPQKRWRRSCYWTQPGTSFCIVTVEKDIYIEAVLF